MCYVMIQLLCCYDVGKIRNFLLVVYNLYWFKCRGLIATIKMNGYDQVERVLNDILRAINPSNEDWTIRFHIIKEIQEVIGSIESLRGMYLILVGKTLTSV